MLNEHKDYFLSESFEKYVAKTTNDVLNIRATYQQERNCTPCTNGQVITYDPYPKGFCMEDLTKEQMTSCILGDTFHEGLHVRYTVCEIFPTIVKLDYIRNNIPAKYHILMKYVIDKSKKLSSSKRQFLQYLFNIIEDAAIEYRGKKDSNFVAKCLILSNSISFLNKKKVEEENNDFKRIMNMVMAYSLNGSIKGEIPTHLKSLFTDTLKPLIIRGRLEKDSFARFNVAFKLYQAIIEYLKENKKEDFENNESNFEEDNSNGNNNIDLEDDLEDGFEFDEEILNDLKFFLSIGSSMDFENISPITITSLGYSSELPISEETKNFLLNLEQENFDEIDLSNLQTVSQKEIDNQVCNDVPYTNIELSKMLEEIKDSLCVAERDFKNETIANLKAIDEEMKNLTSPPLEYPSSFNKNVLINKKIRYMDTYDKERYLEIKKEQSSLVSAFVREIQTIIKNRRDKKYYSSRGKLAQNKLYKTRFSQNTYYKIVEADKPDELVIVVLVDLSASCANERLDRAIEACVVLVEVCEKLNVPISIVGHNAKFPEFNFYYYKRFEGKKDKYAIPTMRADHCNRDNIALLISADMLLRRPEKNKILITLTDGQPSDTHYSGEPARNDMLKLSSFLEKKGISLTGVAISGNKLENDKIARCYKNSISVVKLKELQKELLRFLKPLF